MAYAPAFNPLESILARINPNMTSTRPPSPGDAIAGEFGPMGQTAGPSTNQYGPTGLQNLFQQREQASQNRGAAMKPVKKKASPVRPGEAGLVGLGAVIAHLLGADPSGIYNAYSGYMGQRKAAADAEYENDVNAQQMGMDQAKLQEDLAHNRIQEYLLGANLERQAKDDAHQLEREGVADARYLTERDRQLQNDQFTRSNVENDNKAAFVKMLLGATPGAVMPTMNAMHSTNPDLYPAGSSTVVNPLSGFGGGRPTVEMPTPEARGFIAGAKDRERADMEKRRKQADYYKIYSDKTLSKDIRNKASFDSAMSGGPQWETITEDSPEYRIKQAEAEVAEATKRDRMEAVKLRNDSMKAQTALTSVRKEVESIIKQYTGEKMRLGNEAQAALADLRRASKADGGKGRSGQSLSDTYDKASMQKTIQIVGALEKALTETAVKIAGLEGVGVMEDETKEKDRQAAIRLNKAKLKLQETQLKSKRAEQLELERKARSEGPGGGGDMGDLHEQAIQAIRSGANKEAVKKRYKEKTGKDLNI